MSENLFGEQIGKPKMIPHCEFRTLHGWPHPDTCECKKGKVADEACVSLETEVELEHGKLIEDNS